MEQEKTASLVKQNLDSDLNTAQIKARGKVTFGRLIEENDIDLFIEIVDNSPNFIAVVKDYKYTFINPAGLLLFKCKSPNEIIGRKVLDTISPEYQTSVINRLINSAASSNVSIQLKINGLDNAEFYLDASFIHLTHHGEPATLIIGKPLDVIPNKTLSIQNANELSLDILNAFTEVIAFYSPSHEIIWINESGKKQLNLHDNSYVGKSCHKMWFNSKKPCPSCPMVNNKNRTTERVITFEDETIWRIRHTPLYDRSKQLTGYIEFRQNITESVIREKKQKQVAADSLYINQKNSMLSEIETVLVRTLSDRKFSKIKGDFERIFNIIKSYKQLDKDWKMLIANFEEVHPGFIKKLTDTYPHLTHNDIKHCACIRLNFDTKQIARFFNIKASSVQINRVRLKKKMLLPDSIDLRNFLLNF